MATKQYGVNKGARLEQVTEATGGSAPTADVEVNIKNGITVQQAMLAIDQIKAKISVSKVFP